MPEPIYEYGKYMPSEKAEEDRRGSAPEEIDDSVLEDPLQLPITHELELKGHDGHVTALALGAYFLSVRPYVRC